MENKLQAKYDHWHILYTDAKSKKASIDARAPRRRKLYDGTDEVRDKKEGGISNKKAYCYRNLCFELIETQINNSIPHPKVTPRNPEKKDLALSLEGYLKLEMDRISSEEINDMAERETYIQGTVFYKVGWDELKSSPITNGEITTEIYTIEDLYPQPGIVDFKELEYLFTVDHVSVRKIKKLYNVDVEEDPNYKGLAKLITAWYYNDDGYVSRFGWVGDKVVFDDEAYELRKIQECKQCGEVKLGDGEQCTNCGNNTFKWRTIESETLEEDMLKGDPEKPEEMQVIARQGSEVDLYKIKQLPFVIRRNISSAKSLYGVSDIDLLENNQESINKIHTKMEENLLKGGSLIIKPKGVHIPGGDETLKMVTLKDPRLITQIAVHNLQANMQQDDILQERMYQFARSALGITDSFQGKRDPTAESGKAKEISAAQANGRMESKRRMKDSAYADLYEMMFKTLLAYCDEPRDFVVETGEGPEFHKNFNRYNFLDGEPGNVYYNDRFLFSVDTASILSTNREILWQETTRNFQIGTFGDPANPATLKLYWKTLRDLGYPLAKEALMNIERRGNELPQEMEQFILNNPELLSQVQAEMNGGGDNNVQKRKQ